MIKVVKKSKDSIALLIIEVGNGWGDFPLRQPIHILSKPYPWDPYSGVGGRAISIKTLCQICANLIGTSWHLVTQHATSVTVSIIKIIFQQTTPLLLEQGVRFKSYCPDHLKQYSSADSKSKRIYFAFNPSHNVVEFR